MGKYVFRWMLNWLPGMVAPTLVRLYALALCRVNNVNGFLIWKEGRGDCLHLPVLNSKQVSEGVWYTWVRGDQLLNT